MALVVRTTPQDFPALIRNRLRTAPKAVERGMKSAAQRGRALLARRTPKDRGLAKAAWKVSKIPGIVELFNDAPYIGILEKGARPHQVSFEGRVAIAGWVRRKFGVNVGEAEQIANAIAHKISQEGQKPTYFVRDSMDELRRYVIEEVMRSINKHSRQKRPK